MEIRGRAQLRIQSHVQLDDFSMPEPDISVLQRREDRYATSPPQREHIYFLIEVSESTLARDQKHKLASYARARVAEVWIVDLSGRSIYHYTEPVEEAYRVVQTFREGEEIGSVQLPEVRLRVDEILPMEG